MHYVTKALPNPFADVLADADDVARRSHADDLSVVGHAVESGVDRQPAFAEQGLDVERHLDVGGIHILVLQDDGIEFNSVVHRVKGIVIASFSSVRGRSKS